ncbi:glycosyltransferase [Leuconostoc gelidum subsp. gelidum]|uniref:glycosyltransferase n=1 Tax=Leuconostoc gelidum TaxID=1244 RepID=UPI001CC39B30|nr:glycosyltransferase [Leuconostoc gelidum]MBZ5975033.1 glycosyltransferase [Leuconostoc gelidum subsp. gelidum]MBZ5978036.1 glycosyltransferase [Leuconostoc gelidum subsp. gelidum]
MTFNSSAVSVSIVVFNNADTLKNRLDILLPIFKANHISKVFIIDNHSNDETGCILKKLSDNEPLLSTILLGENKGFGYGHNQAIRKTDNKYHIVMNLDTTPKGKGVISCMEQYMEKNTDIDLLSPLVRFPDENIQYLTRNEPTVFDLGIRFLGSNIFRQRQEKFVHLNDGYDHEQTIFNATGSFMLFRTQTLRNVGGFDEQYFLYMEDTDLTKKINQVGKAIFSPKFEVVHEWQRGNHSVKGAQLMIHSMIKYFNKWGWKLW